MSDKKKKKEKYLKSSFLGVQDFYSLTINDCVYWNDKKVTINMLSDLSNRQISFAEKNDFYSWDEICGSIRKTKK